jgi:hypothetical protein
MMISFEIGIDVVGLFIFAATGYIDLVRRVSNIEGYVGRRI